MDLPQGRRRSDKELRSNQRSWANCAGRERALRSAAERGRKFERLSLAAAPECQQIYIEEIALPEPLLPPAEATSWGAGPVMGVS